MESIIAQGVTPNEVKFLFEEEELRNKAIEILQADTGLKVEVLFGTDENGEEFYLELHGNEDEVTDKLYESGYQVTAPAEDTAYLMSRIIGATHIRYGYVGDTTVAVRMNFEQYLNAKEKSGV